MADIDIRVRVKDEASAKLKDITGLTKDMARQVRNAGLIMVGAGVGIAAGLIAMTKKYADAGEEIHDMSIKTGIAAESLSVFKYMADLTNTSLDQITIGIKTMSNNIADAVAESEKNVKALEKLKFGSKEYNDALKEMEENAGGALGTLRDLGLNIEYLMTLTPENRFWAIAEAIGSIEDPNLRAAAATNMFGRAAMDLIPLLDQGAAGIQQMKDEALEFAPIFDTEAAAACNTFNDSLDRMKNSLMAASVPLIEQLMPGILNLVTNMTNLIKKTGEWMEQHPQLVEGIKLLVAVLVGVGGVLLAIWTVHKAIVAINAALAIMQALSGPAGWAILAASVLAAAGAVLGIKKLMESATEGLEAPPGMETLGGTSPGVTVTPSGRVVAGQKGLIAKRPTIALIGEAGAEAVVPLSRGGGIGSTYNIVIQSEAFMGNESDARNFAQTILHYIRQDQERTVGRMS